MTKAITFTGQVEEIKTHKNMYELKLSHTNQPMEKWYAAKLFKSSTAWVTGEFVDTSDPFADPDDFSAESHDQVKVGDLVTIRTTSMNVSEVLNKDRKTVRKAPNKKKVVKTTFNLNDTSELSIRRSA